MFKIICGSVIVFRDALSKMMDVYTQNPKMGDVKAVEKQLVEQNSKLEKLMQEHQKFSVCN